MSFLWNMRGNPWTLLLAVCPRWGHLRLRCRAPSTEVVELWLACTRDCGLFLEEESTATLMQNLATEESILDNCVEHFDLLSCRSRISSSGVVQKQVLWTDGACTNSQDDRFRRAGSGIYYGFDHALKWHGILPGLY